MAAKSKYTPEIASQITQIIEDGNFEKTAYQSVGISHETYFRWKKTNNEFSSSIKKAKADRIAGLISKIRKDKSWQSAAWMLERLKRHLYHLPTQSEKELSERLDAIEAKVHPVNECTKLNKPKT